MIVLKKLQEFKQEAKGASMVEFALILPLLMTVSLGIYETTNYIFLKSKLNEIAAGVASWVGGETTEAVITDSFIGANLVGSEYDFSTRGGVVVSGIQLSGNGNSNNQKLVWQRASPGATSQITTNGNSGNINSSPAPILDSSEVVLVEITYNYQPIFSYFLSIFPPVSILKVAQSIPTGTGTFDPLPAA